MNFIKRKNMESASLIYIQLVIVLRKWKSGIGRHICFLFDWAVDVLFRKYQAVEESKHDPIATPSSIPNVGKILFCIWASLSLGFPASTRVPVKSARPGSPAPATNAIAQANLIWCLYDPSANRKMSFHSGVFVCDIG